MITQTIFKPVFKEFVFTNESFEFVISKSMHEPPSS